MRLLIGQYTASDRPVETARELTKIISMEQNIHAYVFLILS